MKSEISAIFCAKSPSILKFVKSQLCGLGTPPSYESASNLMISLLFRSYGRNLSNLSVVFFWKNLRRQKYFMKLTNLYQLTNFVKNCILSGFVIKHMIEIKIVLFNLVISRSGWTFYRFADFQ